MTSPSDALLTDALSFAPAFLDRRPVVSLGELKATPGLTLASDGPVRAVYAPFDHIATKARLVVVGLAPGGVDALRAVSAYQRARGQGGSRPEALRAAKAAGAFSGPVRASLVHLLDGIGAALPLGLETTAELFQPDSPAFGAAHLTTALRYPVFVGDRDYRGDPGILATPVLREIVETCLGKEAQALPDALWLPLGPLPGASLDHLVGRGLLQEDRILRGLPDPRDTERVRVFLGHMDRKRCLSPTCSAMA